MISPLRLSVYPLTLLLLLQSMTTPMDVSIVKFGLFFLLPGKENRPPRLRMEADLLPLLRSLLSRGSEEDDFEAADIDPLDFLRENDGIGNFFLVFMIIMLLLCCQPTNVLSFLYINYMSIIRRGISCLGT